MTLADSGRSRCFASRSFVKEAQFTPLLVKEAQVVVVTVLHSGWSVVVFLIKEQFSDIKEALGGRVRFHT